MYNCKFICRFWDTLIVGGTNQVGDPKQEYEQKEFRCKRVVLDKNYYFIND